MKALYCVSSVGLGHVWRSISIARKIKELTGSAAVDWVAAEPALQVIKSEGENVLEVSERLHGLSVFVEQILATQSPLARVSVFRKEVGKIASNFSTLDSSVNFGDYDVIVCDEFWEILTSNLPLRKNHPPICFITDFLSIPYKLNPLAFISAYLLNRYLKTKYESMDRIILANDHAPSHKWFWFHGPPVNSWLGSNMTIAGRISPLSNYDFDEVDEVRREIDLQKEEKLVVATVGGTAVGRDLLRLVASSYREIEALLGSVRIMIVCGPRIDPETIRPILSEKVQVYRYVHRLYRYLAVADCAITQAGMGTLTELASLTVPTLIIPIKGHFEQEQNASEFARKGHMEKVSLDDLTPKRLADQVAVLCASKRTPREPVFHNAAARVAEKVLQAAMN